MTDAKTPSRFLVSVEWVAERCAEAAAQERAAKEQAEAEREQLRGQLAALRVTAQALIDSGHNGNLYALEYNALKEALATHHVAAGTNTQGGTITLSPEDFAAFEHAMKNPKPPTEAMVKAQQLHQTLAPRFEAPPATPIERRTDKYDDREMYGHKET